MNILVDYKHSLMKISRIFAALGSLIWLVLCFQWFRGTRNIPVLEDVRSQGGLDHDPALSVILAARDEERSIKGSVTSILAQDYPGPLEVIAVNDRSTDRTGRILDELASPKTSGTLGRINILSTILVYAHRGKHLGEGLPWWYALLHPIGICVFIYAMLRSATTIIVNGGVEWRGTRYPLKELRASAP